MPTLLGDRGEKMTSLGRVVVRLSIHQLRAIEKRTAFSLCACISSLLVAVTGFSQKQQLGQLEVEAIRWFILRVMISTLLL